MARRFWLRTVPIALVICGALAPTGARSMNSQETSQGAEPDVAFVVPPDTDHSDNSGLTSLHSSGPVATDRGATAAVAPARVNAVKAGASAGTSKLSLVVMARLANWFAGSRAMSMMLAAFNSR